MKAKNRCYPPKQTFKITETLCEVDLQGLLNHTSMRLISLLVNDLKNQAEDSGIVRLRLILKWGCDGSSGFSQFKQKFSSVECSDSNVF